MNAKNVIYNGVKTNLNDYRLLMLNCYNDAKADGDEELADSCKAKLMGTFSAREKEIFADVNRMAGMMAHTERTLKAVEQSLKIQSQIALMMGYPNGTTAVTTSGNNTVLVYDYQYVLDIQALKDRCETDETLKAEVDKVIEEKKAKICIDSLTATDLKKKVKSIPTVLKRIAPKVTVKAKKD